MARDRALLAVFSIKKVIWSAILLYNRFHGRGIGERASSVAQKPPKYPFQLKISRRERALHSPVSIDLVLSRRPCPPNSHRLFIFVIGQVFDEL